MGKPLSHRCEKSTGPEERGLAIDDFSQYGVTGADALIVG